MNNHDIVSSTIATTTTDWLNGTVSVNKNVARMIDTVSGYSSVSNGDHKHPNGYAYEAIKASNLLGEVMTFRKTDSKITQTVVGGLGGITAWDSVKSVVPFRNSFHYNKALEKLNAKARGSLDLSVSIAEYHQVQRMLLGAGKLESYVGNLGRAIQGRKFSKLDTLASVLKDLGGNWLQWQYGLRPLLSDIHDSVREVHRGVIPSLMRIRAKSYDPIVVKKLSTDAGQFRNITVCDYTGVTGVMFHVQFRPGNPFDLARWTSLNPVSLGWELLPYSFVVDWAYDIGSFIRSFETAVLYNVAFDSGYYTSLDALSGEASVKGDYDAGGTTKDRYSAQLILDYQKFRRVPLVSWPYPRLPSWEVEMGSERLLSLASLMAQHLGVAPRKK